MDKQVIDDEKKQEFLELMGEEYDRIEQLFSNNRDFNTLEYSMFYGFSKARKQMIKNMVKNAVAKDKASNKKKSAHVEVN